jgi:hypothetical protein
MKAKTRTLKVKKKKAEEKPDPLDYAARLAELDAELIRYPTRAADAPKAAIKSVTDCEVASIAKEEVVLFTCGGQTFAIGHTDIFYPNTNEARGLRRIHFYDSAKAVMLGIEGDFERHQHGTNLRVRAVKSLVPGPWEEMFLLISNELRDYRSKRQSEFRKHRANDKNISERGHSRF